MLCRLLALLEDADPCSLVLVIALLCYVGSRAAAARTDLSQWSLRLAWIAHRVSRSVS